MKSGMRSRGLQECSHHQAQINRGRTHAPPVPVASPQGICECHSGKHLGHPAGLGVLHCKVQGQHLHMGWKAMERWRSSRFSPGFFSHPEKHPPVCTSCFSFLAAALNRRHSVRPEAEALPWPSLPPAADMLFPR